MVQQAEEKKKKTERVRGLCRRTREDMVKWNQMTALRFQEEGETSDIPGFPSGSLRCSCMSGSSIVHKTKTADFPDPNSKDTPHTQWQCRHAPVILIHRHNPALTNIYYTESCRQSLVLWVITRTHCCRQSLVLWVTTRPHCCRQSLVLWVITRTHCCRQSLVLWVITRTHCCRQSLVL